MSSSSRILRGDELPAVQRILWRDTQIARTRPEPVSKRESVPPAPPPEVERERLEREAYKRGYTEGIAVGKEQASAEVKPVLERVASSLAELATFQARMRRDAEKDLVMLSIAIARRVLHRELTLDAESIAGLIKAALDKLESRDLHRVRLHPDQEAPIRALLERFSAAKIEVIPDSSLNKGDVLFETAHGNIDASVESQLREIERGLTDRLHR
jgi:flagellar assembly protein FliH